MARLTMNKYVGDPALNGFRLTLTSGTPVTTADVTGATTIYYTPYKGDNIVLWDGTNWQLYQSAEVSLALGTLADASNYDVWCRDVNGTLTLDFSAAWTNDTTRSQAIAVTNGVTHKSGDQTRRLISTIRTTSTTTTEDSEAKRFCANQDNRTTRKMYVAEAVDSWTYSTATWRETRGQTTNRLQYVVCDNRELVIAQSLSATSATGAAYQANTGIGIDSTTVNSGIVGYAGSATAYSEWRTAEYIGNPGIGFHFLSWLEWAQAGVTHTWLGDGGTADGTIRCGIFGTVWN